MSSNLLAAAAMETKKAQQVRDCLENHPISLWELRELALSPGGLVNASLRQTAWPLLVGLTDRYSLHPSHWKYTNYFHYLQKFRSYPSNTSSVLSDRDRDLMRRDSTRSVLCRYYTNEFSLELLHQESQKKLLSKKSQELCQVLEMVFEKPKALGSIHYFQGLHDIAAVMLYNLDDTIPTSRILERLCQSHFRETLKDDTFVALKSFLDATLLPLLKKFDTGLYDILSPDEVMLPNIILPWILTWCLHDLENPIIASRLMDALFCGHSTFILYLVVALLMAGRNQILNCSLSDDEECHINVIMTIKGMTSMLVSDYTESTEGKIRIQSLIDDALVIIREVPPRSLIQLAKEYYGDHYNPPSCSFFWKATSSWALTSFPEQSYPIKIPRCILPKSHDYLSNRNTDRAKLASGMSHLIRFVEQTQPNPKKKKNKSSNERLSSSLPWPSRLKSIVKFVMRRWSTKNLSSDRENNTPLI